MRRSELSAAVAHGVRKVGESENRAAFWLRRLVPSASRGDLQQVLREGLTCVSQSDTIL
jgi:hypothetical protein